MRYASSLLDVDVESITGAVAKMKKQLDSGADKFEAIGVAVKDANGEYRNTEAIFNDVVAAIGKIENETERDIVAMDIFGKSADELAGILDDGGQALKELGDEADSLGLIIPQEDIDKANELNDTLDKTKAQLSASIGEAALSTLQALAPVIEKVSEAVQKVAQKLSTVSPQTMQIVLAVLAVIAAISPVAALIANIATAVSLLTPAISALNAALAANPVALVVMAIAALVAIFVTLWNNCEEFRNFWINLWENIKTIVTGAWEAITGWLSETWGKITEAVTGFVNGVKEKFSSIKDAAEEKFTAMKDRCAEIWGNIKDTAAEKWEQVKVVTSTVLNACKEVAQEDLNKIKTAFEENGGGLKGAVAAAWTGIKSAYTAGFDVLNKLTGGKLGEIKDKIVEKFLEIIEKAKTWGKDLIDNFVGGIKDKINSVKDAVGNIANTVKDFLGFSEPEKGPLSNFHTFMPDMIDLMTKGIDQNMYKVQSSMEALAGSMVPDPTINVNYDDSSLRGSLDGLNRSMNNLNTNVTVVLEGDARGLWKMVRQQNNINTRATGRNAFA
jgi:phage-related protein